jgi:hypothetical protein
LNIYMSMQNSFKDEWLDRAFRLAFFLHGERETAKKIALGAMNKLETASTAQFKRHYYTPTGRADNAKATRSRVSLSDLQLLQRLVFVESEAFELEKERGKKTSGKDLLTFFIKHLVRISLKRNSFYVTLAVSRILHNYATADAMEIYNVVVQDPERVHDDYYYRSRKGVLMKELKARFGELLEIIKVNRGEERFSSETAAEQQSIIARECLKYFTPWNSSCAIPATFDPFTDVIGPFHFDKKDPDEEHRTEINRIHATLHPDCFSRLTQALNLSSPEDRMEIPKFMLTENHTNINNDDWRNPPSLDADELQQLKDILSAQAASRKAVNAGFLRVVADGMELGMIDVAESRPAPFELGGDAELIEIYAEDGTLLATHLLNFDELRQGDQREVILLEGGQKISIDLVPVFDEFGEVADVNFAVAYAETAWRPRFTLALRRARGLAADALDFRVLKPAFTFGLILLGLTAAWMVFRYADEQNKLAVVTPPSVEQPLEPDPVPQQPKNEREQVVVDPPKDDLPEPDRYVPPRPENASEQRPRRFAPKAPPKRRVFTPPPSRENFAVNNPPIRKNEIDENGVLRLPIRQVNQIDQRRPDPRYYGGGDRDLKGKLSGKSLAEIMYIYFDLSGDESLGKEIAAKITLEIEESGLFVVTNDKEKADAALKIYTRYESDSDTPEEKTVAVIVRLVNEKGFVVYPNRQGISGWKYVGMIGKLPRRVAYDITSAKGTSKPLIEK